MLPARCYDHARMAHRIVIVGGGFGGVTAALKLAAITVPGATVTLVTDKPWLECYGILYRLIAGRRLSEVCIPLRLIIGKRPIDIVIDAVERVDAEAKSVKGKNGSYDYDTLVLAPGSVSAYFNIPGAEESSMTMMRAAQALAVRRRIEECVAAIAEETDDRRRALLGRFVVVGSGPTGIEIASEIPPVARKLLAQRGLPASIVTVELIEAMDRLLPMAEEAASARILDRMREMGVHVHLKAAVAVADAQGVTLKDGKRIETRTLFWTAGVKAHPLLATIAGVELDRRGRAVVDERLRIKDQPNIFVLGDCAATPFSGTAQTAVHDGAFAARVIAASLRGEEPPVYQAKEPAYAIPAGPWWAAVKFGPLRVYGILGYIMRRAADVRVYGLVMPWRFVPSAFFGRIDLEKHGVDPTAVTGAIKK